MRCPWADCSRRDRAEGARPAGAGKNDDGAKLKGRRTSSTLPELVDLVMARPLVSASMVAKTLDVTPQAARRIVLELGLREIALVTVDDAASLVLRIVNTLQECFR
ncbi:hypothetical protein BWO90_01720 (plasmid) [Sinorhizobium meliloti]|uniref:HTH DNA binding domain-containing protein n=1 Tax=Rhizobium meliloti (strain 1021) TaxID=266834 RepID=Q92ZV6_RHIME|nr:hypothetical protein SMa0649 [Sinorhizobium meliloti 1021]AGG70030.1 Hypothetical protein SM2011_a0649 [Sinorhizobium meliloti 2011]ATA95235.1 hypothetical protein BWO76_01800 [Sinorhizobium meliloti]ATB00943.1 hypothetical protein BWO90_01720 [Sinorhizobium meliloti]RVN97343.1 hypothetical protein CN105_00945 [Sinorhizobium meliloti]